LLACALAMASALAGGCSSKPPLPPPKPYEVPQKADSPQAVKWGYAPHALTLELNADPELNSYDGYSHNVLLCIFQLSDTAAFEELAANQGGIRKLLACDRFDKSVVHFERRYISPGSQTTLVLDRAEGAQFLAVAAGYYDLDPGMVTRSWQFPLKVDQEGMLFWKSDVYSPGSLQMDLLLGPRSIQRMGGD
jgi:type VI secretion system VasD/TssJ family lipoprotein